MSRSTDTSRQVSTDSRGRAIGGYDPVAYVRLGKAVEGSPTFTRNWGGALWFFASQEHASAFTASPDEYVPAFGGHCALAAGFGKAVSASPRAWWIDKGRVHLAKDKLAVLVARLMRSRVSRAAASWNDPKAGKSNG